MHCPHNMEIIGTCSCCGGRVAQYTMLLIVGPFPPPFCLDCGARKKRPSGPVIDMERDERPQWVAPRGPSCFFGVTHAR